MSTYSSFTVDADHACEVFVSTLSKEVLHTKSGVHMKEHMSRSHFAGLGCQCYVK
jgi:hypothetical protein